VKNFPAKTLLFSITRAPITISAPSLSDSCKPAHLFRISYIVSLPKCLSKKCFYRRKERAVHIGTKKVSPLRLLREPREKKDWNTGWKPTNMHLTKYDTLPKKEETLCNTMWLKKNLYGLQY